MSKKSNPNGAEKMKGKKYVKELRKLQGELCKLQEWVKHKGLRVIIIFEGRDAAGKGGTIRALTERVSPRVFRVVALPAPSDREKSQMYMQRYMQHFPAAGRGRDFRPQLVQPRRRRVRHGLLHEGTARAFPRELAPRWRNTSWTAASSSSRSGWRSATRNRSAASRRASKTRLRQWKLSPMDLPSRSKWFEYSRARDMMLEATDTKCAPWYILRSDDKKRARLNCIRAHPGPDPLQESAAREGQAARALDEGRLRRPGVAQGPKVRAGEILNRNLGDASCRVKLPGSQGAAVRNLNHDPIRHSRCCAGGGTAPARGPVDGVAHRLCDFAWEADGLSLRTCLRCGQRGF